MNGVIVVDKPAGWTSHDVVGKLRGALHQRRVGHGGTLDPMATGVLPVFVGRATRAASLCENAVKGYVAGLRLGVTTDSDDITGQILSQCEVTVTDSDVEREVLALRGPQQQVPPMYSAIKVGGKKLYELARRGVEIERQPRSIEIFDSQLLGREENGDYSFQVTCSKGTYIRALCRDIGENLGCGGVMSGLRRVRAGDFTLTDAVPLETVLQSPESYILPVDRLFSGYPELEAQGEQLRRIRNGNPYSAPGVPNGHYRVYGPEGFMMLGLCENEVMHTVKSFFEVEET